jgi:hypothetical protein
MAYLGSNLSPPIPHRNLITMNRATPFPHADTNNHISIALKTYRDSLMCADSELVQFARNKSAKHLWHAVGIYTGYARSQWRNLRPTRVKA